MQFFPKSDKQLQILFHKIYGRPASEKEFEQFKKNYDSPKSLELTQVWRKVYLKKKDSIN